MSSRAVTRAVPQGSKVSSTRSSLRAGIHHARVATISPYAARRQQHLVRSVAAIVFAGGLATASQYYLNNGRLVREGHAEGIEEPPELKFEQALKKKAGASKEDVRDMISSQHLQVKRSWENPGVYAWGSNSGRVVAPDSQETYIKTPRRLKFFDNILLRDIKLDRACGVAIDEKGDLMQWGVGYSSETTEPKVTLKGKDLISVVLSRDRVLGLSSSGKVYSLPMSAEDQNAGKKLSENSWIPFWSSTATVSYRLITPSEMAYGEKVTKIASGLEHALLMTSKGRVFSAASTSDAFPARGQLGVPGLTWVTRPEGDFDKPHEVTTLKGFHIAKIACGDYHSLVVDKEGRVFSFGDNSSGQLGFDYNPESAMVDTPALLPLHKLYSGSSQTPFVTGIFAGGANSYMTVDATRVAPPGATVDDTRGLGRVTSDTFAFGSGIYGNLGNSRWTHVQGTPTRIPMLSGLFEYDEKANKAVPIRLAHFSVGATHAAAVMNNIAHVDVDEKNSENETNWGRDIVLWGQNEHYQIGTGKRSNISTPTYIQPLDQVAERKIRGKEEHRFHITPRKTVRLSNGRNVSIEQRISCGRGCTAVYTSV